MIVVHEWIKDVDGLIPAAAQRYGRHPSALAITAVEEIGMNDNIPLDGCNLGALIRIARGYYLDCETWNQLFCTREISDGNSSPRAAGI